MDPRSEWNENKLSGSLVIASKYWSPLNFTIMV